MTAEPAEALLAACCGLEFAVDRVNTATASVESVTVEDAVANLRLLRSSIATLRQVEAGIERWIAVCFREEGWRDPHELPGLGVVEVRRSQVRRAWQHDLVQSDWLNAYLTELGGEVPDPSAMRDAFLEVAQVGGYKVTGLRALGLDPDDYCSSAPGTPRVVIS